MLNSIQIFKLSIRTKLLSISLILLILPAAITGFFGYQAAKTESDKQTRNSLKNSVRLAIETANILNQSVEQNIITLEQAQGQFKRLLLGSKQKDGTRPINSNIDLGEHGYFFVLDQKGVLLAHPNSEGQSLWERQTQNGFLYGQDLVKNGLNGGGYTEYDWPLPDSKEEALKITYAERDPNWGWIICAGSYMDDYNTGQKHILSTLLWTLAIAIGCGTIVILLFSLHLIRPLSKVVAHTKRLADGDLSTADLNISRRDEIGELVTAFTVMNTNIKDLVSRIQAVSSNVFQTSVTLAASATETAGAARHIAGSVEQIASNGEAHSKQSESNAKAMDEMAAGVTRIAQSSSVAFDTSTQTAKHTESGEEAMQRSMKQMDNIRMTIQEVSRCVELLHQRSSQIEEMASKITEIANQTHLLALNASIEAAHAGDQGRGFAVVASEVKKLAEQSSRTSQHVSDVVHALQSEMENAVQQMTQTETEAHSGLAVIQDSQNTFLQIKEETKHVVTQIEETSAISEEIAAGSAQVAASLEEMAQLSHETLASTQSISAASEEQLANLEQIAADSEALKSMADELQQVIRHFKL